MIAFVKRNNLFETNSAKCVACRKGFLRRKTKILCHWPYIVNFLGFSPRFAGRLSGLPASSLERSSDREPEPVTLAGQVNTGQFLGKSDLCVRVVIIDQAERHVDDRHLDPELKADA